MTSKTVQIKLREEVETERAMIQALNAAGGRSGLARQWLIAGFKAHNQKDSIAPPAKAAASPFGAMLAKGK